MFDLHLLFGNGVRVTRYFLPLLAVHERGFSIADLRRTASRAFSRSPPPPFSYCAVDPRRTEGSRSAGSLLVVLRRSRGEMTFLWSCTTTNGVINPRRKRTRRNWNVRGAGARLRVLAVVDGVGLNGISIDRAGLVTEDGGGREVLWWCGGRLK